MNDAIEPELKAVLRRLKLGKVMDTLPERLQLAQQKKMTLQEAMLVILGDEVERRESNAVAMRAAKAQLDPDMRLERWDPASPVKYDQALWQELTAVRFVEERRNVAIVGPVGVGKTFLAHALGHIACRRGFSVFATSADKALKTLKHARLDHTHDAELRRLLSPDLLIIDDFGLDKMDASESRDAYDILVERHRAGSVIITSNRGPDEWLATFADPMRAQSALDRFAGNAYDLVVDGESYRARLKPKLGSASQQLASGSPTGPGKRRLKH
jgi:DNA replication protein DnaC